MLRGIAVGCGFFGNIHLEGWARVEGGGIVAVVDRDEEKVREASLRFGLAAYGDLARAIEAVSPDFVDVATRPDSHLEMVETAAARGCHVLCQKPIAPTWEESVQVVETCGRHGVRLMINENWRWQPWYRAIKELIEAGTVGQVATITLIRHEADALLTPPFPNQTYFVDMERFLLLESVIHLIDVARFLGGRINDVTCHLRRLSGVTRGEDNVHLHLGLEGGAWAILYSTRCSEPDVVEPVCDYARIEGEKGFLRLDRDGTITVKLLDEPAYEHKYDVPAPGYRGGSVRAVLQHFADSLSGGEPFETEGDDYLKQVMGAVFAGYESAEGGWKLEVGVGKGEAAARSIRTRRRREKRGK